VINAHDFSGRRAAPASAATSGVTELVLAGDDAQQLALLLPMIAHLSNHCQDRWITWIAPSGITRSLLESYGVNIHCMRLIHARTPDDARWITWEALSAGNSHSVIANLGRLTERELKDLEVAAWNGQSQGLLVRSRYRAGELQAA
jgi:cell division inhibitor SulA